ncbi:MAG: hypothetical protein ABGX32_06165, partial [Methylococcales bacterium]
MLTDVPANALFTDTDNNTTYTAGTGITLGGTNNTEFSATSIALTTVQTAVSQSAHLLLTAEEGDIVVRSDENKTYCHNGGVAGTMADYTVLATPTDAVLSVNGNTGAVTVTDTTYDSTDFLPADTSLLAVGTSSTDAAAGNHTHSYLPLTGGTLTGDISFGDTGYASNTTKKITFGDSDDLRIYHDGSNSYIDAAGSGVAGTGSLILKGGDASDSLKLRPQATSTSRGYVELYPHTSDWDDQGGMLVFKGGQDSQASGTVYHSDAKIYLGNSGSGNGEDLVIETGGSALNSAAIVFRTYGNDVKIQAGKLTVDGNEVWHSGNDGSGSGLDADKLDGNEASA